MSNNDWKTADLILELRARINLLEDEVLRLNYRNEAMRRAGDEMADTLNSTYSVEVREANLRDWREAKAADVTPQDPIYRKFLLAEFELRDKVERLTKAGFNLRWNLAKDKDALDAKIEWDRTVIGNDYDRRGKDESR